MRMFNLYDKIKLGLWIVQKHTTPKKYTFLYILRYRTSYGILYKLLQLLKLKTKLLNLF